jgi:polyisoprenoid-binding protein YceI
MTTTTWSIDAAHSNISFFVRYMVSKVSGRFTGFVGTLVLDESDLTLSHVEAIIDARSLFTGNAERDAHLGSADFLDTEYFPELRFRSTGIARVNETHYRVRGQLTIRDVTRPISLEIEFGGKAFDPWGNERAGFVARGVVDRKDFGLRWNHVLEAGGLMLGERVDVQLEVQAVKASVRQLA